MNKLTNVTRKVLIGGLLGLSVHIGPPPISPQGHSSEDNAPHTHEDDKRPAFKKSKSKYKMHVWL